MDFGIARHAKDAVSKYTAANTAIGTPPYMAPEQERGEVRPETDIYAFACCLYEMLTGERAFQGAATTSAKMARQYKRPTRVLGSLPPAVDALIDAALEPDPDKRIRTPAEFRARVDAAFGPVQPPPKA
jgi:serine/threonine-protein kinase